MPEYNRRINRRFTPLEIKKKCCDLSQRFRIKKRKCSNITSNLRPDGTSRLSLTGFTLTEILLVAAMLSVIGLTVYSAFNNGIKIWKRIVRNVIEEDVSIFFEKISRDLKNSFEYTGIKFEGLPQRIAFATLIVPKESENSKYEVGYVAYFEDSMDKSINRQQQNYSQLYQDINPMPLKAVSNIKNLTFEYYYYDPNRDKVSWKSSWKDEENLPLAVRVKVEFYEDNREKTLIKSISVPACKMLSESKGK